jgi:WD40 repeat protein
VFTGGDDNEARLWDAQTAQPLGKPLPHDAPVAAVAYSPDGTTLVTGSADRVWCWNAQSAEAAGEPWALELPVRDLTFAADGTTLLVHCADATFQTVELRDFPSSSLRSKPLQFDAANVLIAYSPDRQSALVGHSQGDQIAVAQLWNISTGTVIGAPIRHDARIMCAEFSRDGRTLVTGGRDQEVRAWDVRSAEAGNSFQHDGIVNDVSVSRDGRTILSGSDDKTARLWDARTGLALGPPLKHSDRILNVALSPDGQVAVTICADGSAHLWDAFSCKRLARPLQYEVGVQECLFNPNGSEILFRCADGTARLYDVPQQLPDNSAFIQTWARARSGFELDDQLQPRQLSQSAWLNAQEELLSLENDR